MAVQAQMYSDCYQNNNMGFANLPQDWGLMSGSGFGDENRTLCFSYERQQDQRVFDSQKVMNSDSDYQNLASLSNSRRNGVIGFQNLASEIERQRLEMNCFLHFQSEKLKAVLKEEARKRDVVLIKSYESKMKALMDAKDEVLNTETRRTNELQNYLLMAEKEAKIWEEKAIENEAMVTDLNRKLHEARERRHEDAESVCNGGGGDGGDVEEESQKKRVCKVCHVRSTCVLLLPCRHLCSCRSCEGLLMFCPVCETVKNGSLEVLFGQS